MKSLRTCAVLALASSLIPLSLMAQERPPIIDMHLHTHHPGDIPGTSLARPGLLVYRGRRAPGRRTPARAANHHAGRSRRAA